jgi:hypothetical protein
VPSRRSLFYPLRVCSNGPIANCSNKQRNPKPYEAIDRVVGQCVERRNRELFCDASLGNSEIARPRKHLCAKENAPSKLIALTQLAWSEARMLLNKSSEIRGASKIQVLSNGFCRLISIDQCALCFVQ